MYRSSAKRLSAFIVSVGFFLGGASLVLASAKASSQQPVVSHPVRAGKSVRMRDYRFQGPLAPGLRREVRNDMPPAKGGNGAHGKVVDPAVQHTPGITAPGELGQFDGLTDADNQATIGTEYVPPDTNGDIGPNNYVEYINTIWAVYDRTGTLQLGPLPGNSFWQGLGGVCETGDDGDPIVKYDRQADRWFASQFYVNGGSGPFHQCIAISVTNDPTGEWYQYDYLISNTGFSDYPKFGIWPDGYYMTSNVFDTPFYGGAFAFDRTAMLAGDPNPTMIAFQIFTDGGIVPSDWNGAIPPPVGAPNYFMTFETSPPALRMWQFHADFVTPANSTLSDPVDLPVPAFNSPVCGNTRDQCVPQLGTSELLETLSQDLMYPLPYRNMGDHESIVATQTVGDGSGIAQVRWYEVRDPGGSPTVYQASTYAPDSTHRWMPSIAMDRQGNIALNYSRSDSTLHPQAAITGRLATDPLNTMGAEDIWFAGAGSQDSSFSRWGDYTSIFLDPLDDCTFWGINEYYETTSSFNFKTRIGSFKFPGCTAGPSGTLEGTVTDGTNPIAGAKVAAGASSTLTDASGHYQFTLPVGTYDMTASKYGYFPASANGVAVSDSGDTVQDFVLEAAPTAVVNGVVKDGSGGGWPLYAKIVVTASGAPTSTIYTDPVTGYYTITLVQGITWNFAVTAVGPGYLPGGGSVPLGTTRATTSGGVVQNWDLLVDALACNAPGYVQVTSGLAENFDAGVLPKGWSITNDSEDGGYPWYIWEGADPCGAFTGNLTGGTGPYALVNSNCDGFVTDSTSLITPSVDFSSTPNPVLRFNEDYRSLSDNADVDISTDGGSSWTNVLAQTADARGPKTVQIDISGLAGGQANVQARWHYYNAFWAWWWQVDNVLLGTASCVPTPGGLVVGNVRDGNSGLGLNGATVKNMPDGASTKTFATPGDPSQDDGFYILFAESGSQPFEASLDLYAPQDKNTLVVPGSTQRLDFVLNSGKVDASPRPLSARVDPGNDTNQTLTLTNSGTASADFEIVEINSPLIASHTHGQASQAAIQQALSRLPKDAKGQPVFSGLSGKDLPHPNASTTPNRTLAAGDVLGTFPTGLGYPWGVGYSGNSNSTWLSNLGVAGGDDHAWEFDASGAQTGNNIDLAPAIDAWAGDGAFNANTGNIWYVNVVNAGGSCIFEVNPATQQVTGNTICPALNTSERGLAYDLATDSYYIGSWLDFTIYHFDASGNILDSAVVGLGISGLAYYPDTGHLFVQVSDPVDYAITVLDAKNNYAVVGSFHVGSGAFDDHGGAGMEADCEGNLWMVNQNNQTLFKVASGETGSCAVDIPWLSEDPTSGTISGLPGNHPAGAANTEPITVTFTGGTLLPGLRQAQLKVKTDTPYQVAPVGVNFTVRFLDVPDSNQFEAYIYGAAGAGIMMGGPPNCPAGILDFCPNNVVTRADMAGYIFRAVHGPSTPPPVYQNIYGDVTFNDYNAFYIQGITDDGITAGCGSGNYCPNTPNTRAQMSVFIWKGQHGDTPPPACTGVFNDVPCPGGFAVDYIEGLYNEGVTAGCGGGNFCPNANITNGQMAVFLVKGFNIPHL